LISSGTAFTFGPQETQDKFSIDTGMISELACKYILHILTITLQLADHALSELYGQPNIAIPSSSSQPFASVGSNLEEIRLKQVSTFPLADFNIPLFLSATLIPSPFQAQDFPDNSLFSFQIGATSQEEGGEATSADSIVLSDEIKAKLQESLQFLNQDIGQLVKNAQPIHAILEELEGKLPE